MTRSLAKPAALVFERITPTGLKPLPAAWTWAEDVRFGRGLAGIGRALPWIIGDWILHMEQKYGERYAQAVEEIGLAPHTAQNYTWVAERFRDHSRRRERLSFSHHEVVASLESVEQDRWLDQAEQEGWTRTQLREALGKGSKALNPPCPPHRCRCGATCVSDSTRHAMWPRFRLATS